MPPRIFIRAAWGHAIEGGFAPSRRVRAAPPRDPRGYVRHGPVNAGTDGAAVVATMDIVYMLVIGLVIGAVARWVMPGKDPGGLILTIVLGIAGSMLGAYLGRQLNWVAASQGAVLVASVIGAVILLVAFRLFSGMRPGMRAS